MKNTLLFLAIFISSISFSQITKADFEKAITSVTIESTATIYIKNKRDFYTDGSTRISEGTFKYEKAKLETNESSVMIYYYSDTTKSKIISATLYPYSSIESLDVSGKFITLNLNSR